MKKRTQLNILLLVASLHCSKRATAPKVSDESAHKALPTFFVTAISENGLILRAEPGKNSAQRALIKFGEAVRVHQAESGTTALVDGIKGEWLIAEYFGETGYIFSGYAKTYSELSKSTSPIKSSDIVAHWVGHRFDSYTKVPVTKLDIKAGGAFTFTLFTGGDGGGFGTRTVDGTWKITGKTLELHAAEGNQRIRYALLKGRLILAEDSPSDAHRTFLENYDCDYPSGLSR